jgi:sugar phosphate permease
MIPLAGVAGTLLYNKLKLKKDILTIVYVLLLSAVFFLFTMTDDIGIFIVLLVLSGFLLYGPHVFLVTTMPCRFLGEKAVASSTGFIDGFGYIGSVLVGILVPFMVDISGGNWETTFYLWAILTFVIAGLVLTVYLKSMRD